MTRWRRRAVVIGVAWLITVASLAAAQMRPSPIPLAGIAFAIGAAISVLVDLADLAEPVSWHAMRDSGGLGRGADPRLRTLHRQLVRAPGRDSEGLHALLIRLIDDRLLAEHSIDRAADPQRASEMLGPDLTTLVAGKPPRNLTNPEVLATILSRIEAL